MLNDKVMTLEKGFISETHVFGLQQTRYDVRSLHEKLTRQVKIVSVYESTDISTHAGR